MLLLSIALVALVPALAVGLVLWRLGDHDLGPSASESFDFTSENTTLSGTLWLPDTPPEAAVVLVHGDGAQDRTSSGGYVPLINTFLDKGIAVAAWDKPGVGASAGNWLHQSMADRTEEARAALHLLRLRFDGIATGAVGFSQAGWVLPELSAEDADFLVLIGAAVNWRDQGTYYTRMRLARNGRSEDEIARILADRALENDRVFGPDAFALDAPAGMSADRWRFIRTNRNADARNALGRLDLPTLAIWGAQDLNVDARHDADIYQALVGKRQSATRIILWPDATHGLLKSKSYNWQLARDWSFFAKLRFLAEGRHAFAPGALDEITGWIRAH